MNNFFKCWPELEAYGKIFPSNRFPGLFYYDYCTSGSGAKAVLILIHGLGDEADTWRHIIPLLGAEGYHVMAPDLPGFGRSPAKRSSSLGCHRDAVLELVKTIAENTEQDIVLIGSSMGAAAAEAAALASCIPAERAITGSRIKALILIDGCMPMKTDGNGKTLLAALPFAGKKWYRSFRNNADAAWRSLFSYYADIEGLSGKDKEFLRARVMDRVCSASQERGYFSSLRSMIFQSLRPSYYRRIGSWPGKISLIWGEKDVIIPQPAADMFITLRGKSSTELRIIPDSGHLPHQEKPAETTAAILDFLK